MRSPWGNSYATGDDANYHAGVHQGVAPSVMAERVAELKKAPSIPGAAPQGRELAKAMGLDERGDGQRLRCWTIQAWCVALRASTRTRS